MQKQIGLMTNMNAMKEELHEWSEVSLATGGGCLLCIVSSKGINMGHNNKIKIIFCHLQAIVFSEHLTL